MPSRRVLLVLVLALLLAIGTFTGFRFFQLANNISPHAGLGDVIGLAQNQDDTPGTLAYKVHHGERVNILMLGYGGGMHDGPYLTDSILVISVQGPDRVALTSVPRDSYVELKALANGGTYSGRINGAYAIPLQKGELGKPAPEYDTGFEGAGKLASKAVGDYLGIKIDYWVGVDFIAFKKVVDAIGGVDVNVPTVLDDTEYPNDAETGYMHVHFNAGLQHMDGNRALIYVRERHADNDFGRSRRQQALLALIKEKVQQPAVISQMYGLLDALKDNVKTNMSLNDIKVFGSITNKINGAGVHHVSIDATNWQYETTGYQGAYLLMPRDATMASLHRYIQAEMVDPAVLAESARVQFTSTPNQASGIYPLGGIFAAALHMLNFNTAAPDTTYTAPPATVVHDYSGGRAALTASWLATYFGGTVVTEDPASAPATADLVSTFPASTPGKAELVVSLGRDVASQFDASIPAESTYRAPSQYQPTYRPYVAPAPQRSAAPTSAPTQEPAPEPSPAPTAPPTQRPSPPPPPPPPPTPPPCLPPACHRSPPAN
ncbi:MAG: hypothetical protein NVSMB17_16930 [Candidatus Dormibacteria bacterium]